MMTLGVATLLFFWILSYYLLPEAILRGRTGAAVLAGDEAADTFLAEFARIALLNLFMLMIIVIANRTLKVNEYPLGYFPPLFLSAIYAITLGMSSPIKSYRLHISKVSKSRTALCRVPSICYPHRKSEVSGRGSSYETKRANDYAGGTHRNW
jgi:hypothetical protein